MPASWGALFDRAAAYDVDRERIHTTSDDLEDESAQSTEADDE